MHRCFPPGRRPSGSANPTGFADPGRRWSWWSSVCGAGAWLVVAGLLAACRPEPARPVAGAGLSAKRRDSLLLFRYIYEGDSVYARRQGYGSFAASLTYYDRAQVLADRWHDRLMQAEVVFAKARVYDAWNKNPRQTVRYFDQAARLFRPLPGQYRRYLYAKHLVAHAYDKMQDSTGAVRVLSELLAELRDKDTARLHDSPFTTEMALIATEVRAYPLAQQLLTRLTRRAWIRNDTQSYDYLNHYYLTRSRLDVLGRKKTQSPYLDSLSGCFRHSHNLMDSLYYATNLARLYAAGGRYQQAYTYGRYEQLLNRQLNNESDIARMQERLVASELLAEKNRFAREHTLRQTRLTLLWGLSAVLVVISGMSVLLYRRNRIYRQQSAQLLAVNQQLDQKVELVELLHKETQHRIKNSLNMVYSLLHMQERRSHQPATVEALQQARLRVETVARLQQQVGNLPGDLNLNDFCAGLIADVVGCFSTDLPVITHIDLPPLLLLPPAHYLPLSLILTEWVINSIKHAVTDGQALHISVGLAQQGEAVRLTYTDNGQPPAGGHLPVAGGLGREIVTLLCRQLNAVLLTDPAHPYHYQLAIDHAG